MSNTSARDESPLEHEYHLFPAFLSYLVPGLGQIAQGRIVKGVLFFVCVLTLFYYGMYLGNWSNVYLPPDSSNPWNLGPPLGNLFNRPQFAAQVFVGVAAWPAILQSAQFDQFAEKGPLFGTYQRTPYESRSTTAPPREKANDPQARREARRDVRWNEALEDWNGKTLNELQNAGDKSWDLGWVFTVIAGALNIMVIYDALAGPAFVVVTESPAENPT